MGERELEHVSTPATRLLVGCMAMSYTADELEHIAEELKDAAAAKRAKNAACRMCGCTDERACIEIPSGQPCSWTEPGLCSACDPIGGSGLAVRNWPLPSDADIDR